jgi:hypothetical protein
MVAPAAGSPSCARHDHCSVRARSWRGAWPTRPRLSRHPISRRAQLRAMNLGGRTAESERIAVRGREDEASHQDTDLRKQDKGRRDSRKSRCILRNPTEYPSCDGGILRQHARAPSRERRAISRRFRCRKRSGCPAAHVPSKGSPRSRLGVACASFSAAELPADGAPDGARRRSTCRGSAAHAVLRCAVDRSGRDPFWKALVGPRCRSTGPPGVGRLASSVQEGALESRGPLWPTRIEMGQGFVNDSSRLRKNGPPLSCFRIILLSNPSAGRSFASVPEVEPPSAALQMQRSSARLDGCARSAAAGGPPAPRSLPVCGSCNAVAARVVNVCVRDSARARRRRVPSTGSPYLWADVPERKGNAPPRTSSRAFSSARRGPARRAERGTKPGNRRLGLKSQSLAGPPHSHGNPLRAAERA